MTCVLLRRTWVLRYINPFGGSKKSCLELNRQLGAHLKMLLPLSKLPSGLVTKNLRPVLESAGPADAAGVFRILVLSFAFSGRLFCI